MGHVRPFAEDDIPHVVELRQKCFRFSDRSSLEELRSYFKEIFFHNPWCDKDLPSLVYQDENRQIVGFLGVVPRRMLMKGRPIRVAVSTQFMVDPSSRSSLAAVQLLKRFYSGPQDLSFADLAYDSGRRLWESLGGTAALLYSIYWTRILRPCRYGIPFLRTHGLPRAVGFAVRPIFDLVDAIVTRIPSSPFRQVMPQGSGEEMDTETLLKCFSEFSGSQSLWPEYDHGSLQWLLEKVGLKKGYGTLQKVVIRSAERVVLGWYLYFLIPRGISTVIQITARRNAIEAVLDHLFHHAWQHGAVALVGRLEPRFLREFSNKYCYFHSDGPSVLVHSHNSEVLQAVLSGDAFLTRLEGEWWLSF